MANHKSAEKAHEKSVHNHSRNQSIMTKIKTFIKKVEELLLAGKNEEAVVAMREAESQLMKGVSKGVLKKNTASRKVSKLTQKVKGTKSIIKTPVKKATTAKKAAVKKAAVKKSVAKKAAVKKTTSKKA